MCSFLDLVRGAAAAPGLRRLTRFTPLTRATGALRGTLVRERLRFALNELRRRDVAARYTLREHDRPIVIRHHTSDVMILDEIFSAGEYQPPAPAQELLDALPAPRVVDLGANIGLFGVWILSRTPGATIVGYEPDPRNVQVHERVIEANGAGARWRLRPVAAATAAGEVRFSAGHGSASHVALHGSDTGDITVQAADAMPDLLVADFAKIDIEGSEWALLDDPRFGQLAASVLFLEYHPHGCPGADPRIEAIRRVEAAGYTVEFTAKSETGVGVVWGWRAKRHPQGHVATYQA